MDLDVAAAFDEAANTLSPIVADPIGFPVGGEAGDRRRGRSGGTGGRRGASRSSNHSNRTGMIWPEQPIDPGGRTSLQQS